MRMLVSNSKSMNCLVIANSLIIMLVWTSLDTCILLIGSVIGLGYTLLIQISNIPENNISFNFIERLNKNLSAIDCSVKQSWLFSVTSIGGIFLSGLIY